MQEEFHADRSVTPILYKQLYGWGTMNTNVWLPSLSELVGIDPNRYSDTHGCYYSAMQGINLSTVYWTDAQGGTQFAYFQQFNASGGSQKIWNVCKQEQCWLRSPDFAQSKHVTAVLEGGNPSTYILPTTSRAVHPARRYKFHIPRFHLRRKLAHYTVSPFPTKHTLCGDP